MHEVCQHNTDCVVLPLMFIRCSSECTSEVLHQTCAYKSRTLRGRCTKATGEQLITGRKVADSCEELIVAMEMDISAVTAGLERAASYRDDRPHLSYWRLTRCCNKEVPPHKSTGHSGCGGRKPRAKSRDDQ